MDDRVQELEHKLREAEDKQRVAEQERDVAQAIANDCLEALQLSANTSAALAECVDDFGDEIGGKQRIVELVQILDRMYAAVHSENTRREVILTRIRDRAAMSD